MAEFDDALVQQDVRHLGIVPGIVEGDFRTGADNYGNGGPPEKDNQQGVSIAQLHQTAPSSKQQFNNK